MLIFRVLFTDIVLERQYVTCDESDMEPISDPFAALEARRIRREQERMEINKRLAALNAEAGEDATALRVLRQIYPDAPKGTILDERSATTSPAAKVHSSIVAAMQQHHAAMTIKDVILAVLREAAPEGLTAHQIKGRAQTKFGKDVNANTLTVSLVRASKEKGSEPPLVRCDGRIWYFIGKTEGGNVRAPELALHNAPIAMLKGGNHAAE